MSSLNADLGLSDVNATGGGCCGGGCCGGSATADAPIAITSDVAISVDGMTCSTCVKHVTTAVTALAGVTDVTVELNAGGTSTVYVAGTNLDGAALRAAIIDAGYQPA